MIRRLLMLLACAALGAACQTQPPVSKTAPPAPSSPIPSASVPPAFALPAPSGTFVPTVYRQMRPDAAHAWSSGPWQFPSFDRTVKDPSRATALLEMAAQLHVAPFRWCPIDFGYGYAIEWSQGGRIVAEGSLQAQGCRELRLDNGPSLETTPAFWTALADLLGVPEPSLHPTLP